MIKIDHKYCNNDIKILKPWTSVSPVLRLPILLPILEGLKSRQWPPYYGSISETWKDTILAPVFSSPNDVAWHKNTWVQYWRDWRDGSVPNIYQNSPMNRQVVEVQGNFLIIDIYVQYIQSKIFVIIYLFIYLIIFYFIFLYLFNI